MADGGAREPRLTRRVRAGRLAWPLARGIIAAVLIGYLGLSGVIEWSAMQRLAAAWPLMLVALAAVGAALFVTAWRLCVLLRPCGLELSLPTSVRLHLIGSFFATCLPGLITGDAVKAYYASTTAGGRTEFATVMLLDRAVGMLALFIWPLLAAPFFPSLLTRVTVLPPLLAAAAAAAVTLVACLAVVCSTGLWNTTLARRVLPRVPFRPYVETIIRTLAAYRGRSRALCAALVLAIVAHGLSFVVVLLAARAVNPDNSSPEIIVLSAFGFLANSLPITPGGLGVGEAAFERLFSVAGFAAGAETMLGWRLVVSVQAVLGLCLYLRGRQGIERRAETGAIGAESALLSS